MRKRLMIQVIAIAALICCLSPAFGNDKNDVTDALTCNSQVRISLNKDCGGATPIHFIESGLVSGDLYTIELEDGQIGASTGSGTISVNEFTGIDWTAYAGNPDGVEYKITDPTSNSCWGQVIIEANIIPTITSNYSTTYNCDASIPPGMLLVTSFEGKITDNDVDDILLDINWYGVGAINNWYADLMTISVPANLKTCSVPSFDLKEDFNYGVINYDNTVDLNNTGGSLLFLDGDGVPIIPAPAIVAGGIYNIVVYADHGNGVGDYELRLLIDETACPGVTHDLTDIEPINCNQSLPDDWVHYDGEEGSGAFLDIMSGSGCGIAFTALPPSEIICGDINDDDGEIHVIKYEILLELHGKTVLKEVLRQAYRLVQEDFEVCAPSNEIVMPCGSDSSLEGVFNFKKAAYIKSGFDDVEATILAKKDVYPHACGEGFLDYKKEVLVKDHYTIENGTTTELIWRDLNGDGVRDVNEWIESTFVEKIVVDTLVMKTVVCKVSDGLSAEEISYGCIEIENANFFEEKYCGFTIEKNDVIISECGGGLKIARNWRLINWSDLSVEELTGSNQKIILRDTESPIIKLSSSSIDGVLNVNNCQVEFEIPAPIEISDNCASVDINDITYTVNGFGTITGNIFSGFIPAGQTSVIVYHLNDGCGNRSTAELTVVPTDNTSPVNVCEQDIVVSLTPDLNGGIGKIYADMFDNGSHDNGCGGVSLEVIRMEDLESGLPVSCDPILKEIIVEEATTDKLGNPIPAVTELRPAFGDFVKFCCEDVLADDLRVVLRVTDDFGNANDCMVNVQVQDKISGLLICSNYSVTCLDLIDAEPENIPSLSNSICNELEVVLLDVSENVNSCGSGSLVREWGALSNGDTISTCTQLVTVESRGSFDPFEIRWPLHYTDEEYQAVNKEINPVTGNCEIIAGTELAGMNGQLTCLEEIPLCRPTFPDRSCGLIGATYEDEIVYFDDDACQKTIRRWSVVDWCTYEPNNPENIDDENDSSSDNFQLVLDWCETTECHGNSYFEYSKVDPDGYYTFDQVIKIVDDQGPTLDCEALAASSSFDGSICSGSISASAVAMESGPCASGNVTWSIFLNRADETVVESTSAVTAIGEKVVYDVSGVPEGDYVVSFIAKDGCGNSSEICGIEVSISDTKAPTPICLQALSTAVMQAGVPSIDIWASDYNIKSEDNCTPQDELRYSFSEDSIVSSLTFGCDDANGFPQELKMWVWDNSDNKDFCFVELKIDGDLACGEGTSSIATISGHIQTEMGEMINNAEVTLMSNHPEYPSLENTNLSGTYAFGSNPMHLNYELEVNKNEGFVNGVSTLDLVLMNKHILGLASLDSPYKIIAADVNNSGNISASDLVQLRKLILGLIDELPNNKSWRFVDAKQTFLNPNSPWPFVEKIDLVNLSDNMMKEDFIGIKIGDVNNTAQANSLIPTEIREKGSPVLITIENREIDKDELIEVKLKMNKELTINGFQFTLEHRLLELVDISSELLVISEANYGIHSGMTTVSWNSDDPIAVSDQFVTIKFRGTQNISLADVLDISSAITPNEIYVGNDSNIGELELLFNNNVENLEFQLFQNKPNPFKESTQIKFTLPVSDMISLSVHNVEGKIVYNINKQYPKGTSILTLDKNDIGGSGVYFYTLKTKSNSLSQSMIVID